MKKIAVLVIIFGMFLGAMPAWASSVASMGFIDVQKIFKEYKETEKAQSEIKKEEEAFKSEFESKQKKIEEAKKSNKNEKDIAELTSKLEKELSPRRERLVGLSEKLTAKIQSEIIDAVKSVAKNVGVDIVFDKQVIITGGLDLTDMVVNKLNKK